MAGAEIGCAADFAEKHVDLPVGRDDDRAVHEICLDDFTEESDVGHAGGGAVGENAGVGVAAGCDDV